MKLVFFIPYLASILFCVVTAFIYRKYLHSKHLTILLPYLVLVFIQETTLGLAFYLNYYTSNAVVYNIYRLITVLVFFWIYYKIPFMVSVRRLMLSVTITYLGIILVNYCLIESIFTPSSYLSLTRGIVITFYGVLFLFRYFYLDNIVEEKYWRPLIWITIGIVIFYPVISISINFQKYLATNSATLYGLKLYNVIPQVMSIFLYGCFSYAFYLCQKKN
jgi:hypothetical protein